MKRFSSLLLCLLGGAATGLCLMLPTLGPAVFFTLVPAFFVLRKKATFSNCAVFALALCMVGYFPAFYVNPAIDGFPVFWVDLLVYIIICLVHGLVIAGALKLSFRLPVPKGMRWLCVAVFWAVAEWLLGTGPVAWPTLRLSLTLWRYPFLIQGARIGGQLFVGAIIVSVNMILSKALLQKNTKKSVTYCFLALLLFLSNTAFSLTAPALPASDTRVALVQPGLTELMGYSQSEISRSAEDLAYEAAKTNPDLIILSEGSMPVIFADEPRFLYSYGYIPKSANADMIACGNMNNRSTAYHFTPDGTLDGIRPKVLEVPFFENGVNSAFRWIPEEPGAPVVTKNGKVGIMICYESMFPTHASKLVSGGADMFAVVTNDSWFDTPLAQNLHIANGIYRAVETGRPLVQSSINGITAAIDIRGNVIAELKSSEPGVLYADVSMTSRDTPYLLWGDKWLYLALFAVLISVLLKKRRTHK